MNAIIVGCGKVGTELTESLIRDGHNVSVIDNSQEALDKITDRLDVLPLYGNGSDIRLLEEAGVEDADLFLAVSTSDETNLLSCVLAKGLSSGISTIARVRNPIYSKQTPFFIQRLGLSRIINPEQPAANEIYKLLRYPALSRVDFIEDNKVVIFTLTVEPEYRFTGKSLMELKADKHFSVLATAADRDGDIFIPKGDYVLTEDDIVSFVCPAENLDSFLTGNNIYSVPAKDILIVGGGTITHYLTEKLLDSYHHIRVIENDPNKALILSEKFTSVDVVMGDGTDTDFLLKQGLADADALVMLTGIDEENIIVANSASKCSDARAIAKVDRLDLYDIARELDIDSLISPKKICAETITRYVRAMGDPSDEGLEELFRYMDSRLEISEYIAGGEDESVLNTCFMDMRLKKDIIVACIIRDGHYIIPDGQSKILDGDAVVIVTTRTDIADLTDIVE